MKKLNLLGPALVKGYVKFNGQDQEVAYLKIEEGMDSKALKEDLDLGAKQFEECLVTAEKGLSRVVVVRAKNEEDGLMAVNYLAGICNAEKGVCDVDELEDCLTQEADYEDLLEDVDVYFRDYEEEDSEEEEWEESACRVPVVTMQQIDRYSNMEQPFFENNFIMAGIPNTRNNKPYWFDCIREKICIVVNLQNYGFFGAQTFANMTNRLKRFQKNEKVFVLVIDDNMFSHSQEDEEFSSFNDQDILNFVLENTADMIRVNAKEENLIEYRRVQFDNWLSNLGMRLATRFPKQEILNKILKIKNENKSEAMKMVLKYVQKESRKNSLEAYTKKDFAILSKFQALGMEESNEKKYATKLNSELVGLEKVKEQIHSIIQVMKYNKYRKEINGTNCNYHNVHLMIGAPGTAKTTVAQIMGNMMREENLLRGNRFACVNGADLKGMYVGHSAPKVQQLFHQNDIILIDEAYSLVSEHEDSDSFSQEAMAQLILEIEEHGMEKLIMFAGYGGCDVSEKNNKMKKFIDANPGLKSRINSTIYFESYTPKQMVDIVHLQAKNQELTVDKKADGMIHEYFETRVKNPNFGNGREARSLLENALTFAASRIMQLPESKRTKKVMNEVTFDDMKKAIEKLQRDNLLQMGQSRGTYGFC